MKNSVLIIFLLAMINSGFGQNPKYNGEAFAHTYSIVARDSITGEMAVGVQSHWFSVGTLVSWGKAGVGVVATQSFVNPAYGPEGLRLIDRKSTRLNSSHVKISYAVFCLKKKI